MSATSIKKIEENVRFHLLPRLPGRRCFSMSTFTKAGVEISMPPMDKTAKLNMERCAEFMARMIEKYGKEVLAEIEAEEAENANQEQK